MFHAVKLPRGNGSSRIQRKFSILSVLYDERYGAPDRKFTLLNPDDTPVTQNSGEWSGWLTTYQIARKLGLEPTSHLRGMLTELQADSFVLKQTQPHRGNVHKHMWKIADNARYSATWRRAFDAYLHGLAEPTIESNMGES